MRFDLELFEQLNQEYAAKPSHSARSNDAESVRQRGEQRASWLDTRFGVSGKRCLEVGCGRGEVARALAARGCEVVGVDVKRYPEWDAASAAGPRLVERDIAAQPIADLGRFDLIFSFSVWEHIRQPREALRAAKRLLRRRGDLYLSANLHRGTQASHRYREVFFPWPHLLFSDEVFERFYEKRGLPRQRAAWVHCWTAAEYLQAFAELGLSVLECSYATKPIDEAFYARFEDVLSRYPRADLERDFIKVHLRHKPLWRRAAQTLLSYEPRALVARAGHLARLASARWG
jgi:2-polyprenyl-3-methyl-5-hydroxy-6-metoxy-1,4-benzoquinol methylase